MVKNIHIAVRSVLLNMAYHQTPKGRQLMIFVFVFDILYFVGFHWVGITWKYRTWKSILRENEMNKCVMSENEGFHAVHFTRRMRQKTHSPSDAGRKWAMINKWKKKRIKLLWFSNVKKKVRKLKEIKKRVLQFSWYFFDRSLCRSLSSPIVNPLFNFTVSVKAGDREEKWAKIHPTILYVSNKVITYSKYRICHVKRRKRACNWY